MFETPKQIIGLVGMLITGTLIVWLLLMLFGIMDRPACCGEPQPQGGHHATD